MVMLDIISVLMSWHLAELHQDSCKGQGCVGNAVEIFMGTWRMPWAYPGVPLQVNAHQQELQPRFSYSHGFPVAQNLTLIMLLLSKKDLRHGMLPASKPL